MPGILDKVFGNTNGDSQTHLYVAFIVTALVLFIVAVQKGLGPSSVL